MKFWEALRESFENGAWVALVGAGCGYTNGYAHRWDKASGLWQLAYKEGPRVPWRRLMRSDREDLGVDIRRFALEAEWEIVAVGT